MVVYQEEFDWKVGTLKSKFDLQWQSKIKRLNWKMIRFRILNWINLWFINKVKYLNLVSNTSAGWTAISYPQTIWCIYGILNNILHNQIVQKIENNFQFVNLLMIIMRKRKEAYIVSVYSTSLIFLVISFAVDYVCLSWKAGLPMNLCI